MLNAPLSLLLRFKKTVAEVTFFSGLAGRLGPYAGRLVAGIDAGWLA